MDQKPLVLIANPGSASRRYSLFSGSQLRGRLHFELENDRVVCGLERDGQIVPLSVEFATVEQAAGQLTGILRDQNLLQDGEVLFAIGLRIVAPSSFFQADRVMDESAVAQLRALRDRAPLHITASLHELAQLQQSFQGVPIVGVSDSAFHAAGLEVAKLYGLPLDDAGRLDLKRFGYHGLSVASVVREIKREQPLPPRLIVCHLGGGASITAVHNGQSLDNTMGYSPLEGLLMATRSGSLDPTVVTTLMSELRLDAHQLEKYLNTASGLLGVSGRSSDIRWLLEHEAQNDRAALALQLYVYRVQLGIGQMVASLQGVDALAFTGAVGERSAPIRSRVVEGLAYLGFGLDEEANNDTTNPTSLQTISRTDKSKPVTVVPSAEERESAARVLQALKS